MRKIKFFKIIFVLIFLFLSSRGFGDSEVFENYIVIYGEGPYGQWPIEFDVTTYTKQQAEEMAKQEIATYLSGMVYGYQFEYQTDNPLNKRKEVFQLTPVHVLGWEDRNFSFRQYEVSKNSIRIRGTYQLSPDQKNYIRNFCGTKAQTAVGEYCELNFQDWNNRYKSFEEAVKNAVLNKARKEFKSRPEQLKGKLILKESPKFYPISGSWRVIVRIHLFLDEVNYQKSY